MAFVKYIRLILAIVIFYGRNTHAPHASPVFPCHCAMWEPCPCGPPAGCVTTHPLSGHAAARSRDGHDAFPPGPRRRDADEHGQGVVALYHRGLGATRRGHAARAGTGDGRRRPLYPRGPHGIGIVLSPEGVAPSTDCPQSTTIGKRAFVPYTADSFFYKVPKNTRDRDARPGSSRRAQGGRIPWTIGL
jgi:hypothetical protein